MARPEPNMRSQKCGKGCDAALASITIMSGFELTCALISGPSGRHTNRRTRLIMRQFHIELFISPTTHSACQVVSCCPGAVGSDGSNVSRRLLLQQKFRRLHSRMAVKPTLHHIIVQEICD